MNYRDELSKPRPGLKGGNAGRFLSDALGVDTPNLVRLLDIIWRDFDKERKGIGWWKSEGEGREDTQRRILVADYLLGAAGAARKNLVETQIHLGEWRYWLARETEEMSAESEFAPPRGWTLRGRPTLAAYFPSAMMDLHLAGFCRAVGSVLDVFGSVVVGVMPLPKNILKYSWTSLFADLDRTFDVAQMEDLRKRAKIAVRAATEGEGAGWDQWVWWYRNTFVHRARRMEFNTVDLVPGLFRPDRSRAYIFRPRLLLAIDPDMSDVQAIAANRTESVPTLTEDAEVTLPAVAARLQQLVDTVAAVLCEIWILRRETPGLVPQPIRDQWPNPAGRSGVFVGFRPGDRVVRPGELRTNPDVIRRMIFAGLGDDERPTLWAPLE